jgi:hypothetical protein
MSRRVIALAAFAAAIVTAPVAVQAQGSVKFGIAAGATFPTGDAGDSYDWGYHVAGSITGRPMASPVGIRGEIMYHQLTGKDDALIGKLDNANIIGGLINAELAMGGVGIKPYLIGGIGWYRLDFGEGIDSQNKFGFNAGAGLDFGLAGFSSFIEARYHSVQTEGDSNLSIVPVTFGLRF